MDANNTRFHFLLGREDWLQHMDENASANISVDDKTAMLTLLPEPFVFPGNRGESYVEVVKRGADRDVFGSWYWIDGSSATQIKMLGAGSREASVIISMQPADAAQFTFNGLALIDDTKLIASVNGPSPHLRVWDLEGDLENYTQISLPADTQARDLCKQPFDGSLWLLDYNLNAVHPPRLLKLAADLCSLSVFDFPAIEGAGTPYAGVPVAVEALPDGSILILDVVTRIRKHNSRLIRFVEGIEQLDPVSITETLAPILESQRFLEEQSVTPFFARNIAVTHPAGTAETQAILYVVGMDGNQAFSFDLSAESGALTLRVRPNYLPLKRFTGKAIVAVGDTVYYHRKDRWLPIKTFPRPRFAEQGQYVTHGNLLDGKKPDCVWHRLFIEARIPPETEIIVESRAANQQTLLKEESWHREPALYKRGAGPEIPTTNLFTAQESARTDTGTWELLFQHAKGQSLQLRLTLKGNRRVTPKIYALRVYYDRFSYVDHYLPAVYREDEVSASFLERFLANIEGTYTDIEDKIIASHALFDPRIANKEYLEWLASWLGIFVDPVLDESRRRLFLQHATLLFRERGTLPGLIRAIRLITDPAPDASLFAPGGVDCNFENGLVYCKQLGSMRTGVHILEHFQLRNQKGNSEPTESEQWHYFRLLLDKYGTFEQIFNTYQPLGDKFANYQSFLEHAKQAGIDQLSLADQFSLLNFDSSPPESPARHDWENFVTIELPIMRTAHRFTVMVPVSPDAPAAYQQELLSLVRHVVNFNKPAHTLFDIQPHWLQFKVGEARLGLETLIDQQTNTHYLTVGESQIGEHAAAVQG